MMDLILDDRRKVAIGREDLAVVDNDCATRCDSEQYSIDESGSFVHLNLFILSMVPWQIVHFH